MKISKKKSQLFSDALSVEIMLEEAKRKKRNAIIGFIVYTVLILGCCILWEQSKLSVFNLVDCIALIGCTMAAVVVGGIAIALFAHLCDKQLRALEFYTDMDWLITNVVSFLVTAIAICLPCYIILFLIASIEPLFSWLATPIVSILRYRGVRLAGCILAVIPYLLLWLKFSKNKKDILLCTQLLKELQAQKELADLEQANFNKQAKSKSWEKMKAQRRAAEQRKASLSRNAEENSEDDIQFL